MHVRAFPDSRLVLPATVCALLWSTGAVAQPCTSGSSVNSNPNVAQVSQQLTSANKPMRIRVIRRTRHPWRWPS
jgi:hypothetical protein